MPFWRNCSGKFIVNTLGKLLKCPEWPCEPTTLPCNNCLEGTWPSEWEVVIAGVTGCLEDWNGTYFVPSSSCTSGCVSGLLFSEKSCGLNYIGVQMSLQGGQIVFRVLMMHATNMSGCNGSGFGIVRWEQQIPSKMQCNEISGVVLPNTNWFPSDGSGTNCITCSGGINSTATISAR